MPMHPSPAHLILGTMKGRLANWNVDRGFGFFRDDNGGRDIFVHITAFLDAPAHQEPIVGQLYEFHLQHIDDQHSRAFNVHAVNSLADSYRRPALEEPTVHNNGHDAAAAHHSWLNTRLLVWQVGTFILFVAAALGIATKWVLPVWIIALYVAASAWTFWLYWLDKTAAARGEWRIREQTLQFFSLFCGWPGAMLAQQMLHHKSRKQSFQTEFWFAVVGNIAVFLFFLSPVAAVFWSEYRSGLDQFFSALSLS